MHEAHVSQLALAVLGQQDRAPPPGRQVRIRVLVYVHHGEAADEGHRIGVLLDRAGVPEVG